MAEKQLLLIMRGINMPKIKEGISTTYIDLKSGGTFFVEKREGKCFIGIEKDICERVAEKKVSRQEIKDIIKNLIRLLYYD